MTDIYSDYSFYCGAPCRVLRRCATTPCDSVKPGLLKSPKRLISLLVSSDANNLNGLIRDSARLLPAVPRPPRPGLPRTAGASLSSTSRISPGGGTPSFSCGGLSSPSAATVSSELLGKYCARSESSSSLFSGDDGCDGSDECCGDGCC